VHLADRVNEITEALRQRARRFAVRLVKFLRLLPRDPVTTEIVRQISKSGPSVSANYRAACRGRSRREYIAKLGTVVEEADETEHWLLVLIESEIASGSEVEVLFDEACQLPTRRAITTSGYIPIPILNPEILRS
jgi:four helix bundle protein